jgi:hypothetical protein
MIFGVVPLRGIVRNITFTNFTNNFFLLATRSSHTIFLAVSLLLTDTDQTLLSAISVFYLRHQFRIFFTRRIRESLRDIFVVRQGKSD